MSESNASTGRGSWKRECRDIVAIECLGRREGDGEERVRELMSCELEDGEGGLIQYAIDWVLQYFAIIRFNGIYPVRLERSLPSIQPEQVRWTMKEINMSRS